MKHLARAHWANFLYRHTARRWHALRCRWSPTGELRDAFHAERSFTPLDDESGCEMAVAYHYEDERGTLCQGPLCGPWRLTESEHSCPDGVSHPASTAMTTLLLPELFLHHGKSLRMSAGVVHAPDGSLQQLSLIREDARGAWPSKDWSLSRVAALSSPAGLQVALKDAGAPTSTIGAGYAITAGLRQRPITATWAATRVGAAEEDDTVLLCAENRVAIVATARAEGRPFCSGVAWWPADADAATLHTVQAAWDCSGALEEVRYVEFEEIPPKVDL
ncbi:hypothetical protein CYMTET_25897 [Cymbomonas tetramitiformis]|uniref:DUF3598 domain-containing protein n=1 Tax=Cymbomonas tetramitiformis TaxID=36881 RepID=A0AAE0FUG2_9CHLO|nr:hypothetical protein CYMTET_46688 [Cymbomonas tetramitiformis]KAK3265416.1 hypothetical protein CYMTET_25897 [Cymbomonas tetramitiformis]